MGRGRGTNTLGSNIAEPTSQCNEANHACWNGPDSLFTRVTWNEYGAALHHRFENISTWMPVGCTEIVQVERRVLGGSFVSGKSRSEHFVGGLPEDKKQRDHGSGSSRHDCLDDFFR
jgi:hypothetical protein